MNDDPDDRRLGGRRPSQQAIASAQLQEPDRGQPGGADASSFGTPSAPGLDSVHGLPSQLIIGLDIGSPICNAYGGLSGSDTASPAGAAPWEDAGGERGRSVRDRAAAGDAAPLLTSPGPPRWGPAGAGPETPPGGGGRGELALEHAEAIDGIARAVCGPLSRLYYAEAWKWDAAARLFRCVRTTLVGGGSESPSQALSRVTRMAARAAGDASPRLQGAPGERTSGGSEDMAAGRPAGTGGGSGSTPRERGWSPREVSIAGFRGRAEGLTAAMGEDLVGRAAAARALEWLTDCSLCPPATFRRSGPNCPVRAGVALPTFHALPPCDPFVVFAFFSARALEYDGVVAEFVRLSAAAGLFRLGALCPPLPPAPAPPPSSVLSILTRPSSERDEAWAARAEAAIVAAGGGPFLRKFPTLRAAIVRHASLASFSPGHLLFERGEAGTEAYLIVLGTVACHDAPSAASSPALPGGGESPRTPSSDGWTLRAGDVLGETALLAPRARRLVKAVCREEVLAVAVDFAGQLLEPGPASASPASSQPAPAAFGASAAAAPGPPPPRPRPRPAAAGPSPRGLALGLEGFPDYGLELQLGLDAEPPGPPSASGAGGGAARRRSPSGGRSPMMDISRLLSPSPFGPDLLSPAAFAFALDGLGPSAPSSAPAPASAPAGVAGLAALQSPRTAGAHVAPRGGEGAPPAPLLYDYTGLGQRPPGAPPSSCPPLAMPAPSARPAPTGGAGTPRELPRLVPSPRAGARRASPSGAHAEGGRRAAPAAAPPHSGGAKRKRSGITLEAIEALYHLPLHRAAEQIGVSSSTLKLACRELGVLTWPHRRVKLEQSLAASVHVAAAQLHAASPAGFPRLQLPRPPAAPAPALNAEALRALERALAGPGAPGPGAGQGQTHSSPPASAPRREQPRSRPPTP
eukprot:tig00021428_g21177.t1